MATLESPDSNILDAETINWRLILYPLLAAALLVGGGFGYYYYQLNQREVLEAQAHETVRLAKTPEELVKAADQFPKTDQAGIALLNAGEVSFTKRDFASSIADYRRIIDAADTDAELRDSARLGLAAALEASGKPDDAINTYLEVARHGDKSAYAPFAYSTVAHLYEQRNDKANERAILTEESSLNSDSPFVKQAQAKLKAMQSEALPPLTVPVGPASATVPPAPEKK